ncbi:MAG TPA: N-acetylneuraminate synthase [Candidatus Dormibacteraeota bacterium]|nr:N-acetylneuraminate synthase [Candidatus Dormibacteraeota bacterium]
MPEIELAGRRIGDGRPCFIIAEAGVNHNGHMRIAHELVGLAAEAGADAIKFQTFAADRLATAYAPKALYQVARTGGESAHEMLKQLELSREDHLELIDACRREGIMFLSSAFDEESADLLEDLGVEAFKVPSGEVTNLPYLRHLARKRRPLIVSTGMADLEEVERAFTTIREAGPVPVALLHCVSLYPSPAAGSNLRAMQTMRGRFGVPVGFSDHTEGFGVALAAVALGAAVIEKHFTTDRGLPGPDHAASLEPAELRAMIEGIRVVESALGDGVKQPLPEEAETAKVARKSVVAGADIAEGAVITREMLTLKRPATGLPPAKLDWVVGRRARVPIRAGSVITSEMV